MSPEHWVLNSEHRTKHSELLKKISPHADAQKEPNADERRNHERPTITEQGERNPYHRHDAQHHSDVDEDMPEEHGHHTESENGAKAVFRLDGNPESPEDQNNIQSYDEERTDQTPFFSQGRENEVGLLLGKKS